MPYFLHIYNFCGFRPCSITIGYTFHISSLWLSSFYIESGIGLTCCGSPLCCGCIYTSLGHLTTYAGNNCPIIRILPRLRYTASSLDWIASFGVPELILIGFRADNSPLRPRWYFTCGISVCFKCFSSHHRNSGKR